MERTIKNGAVITSRKNVLLNGIPSTTLFATILFLVFLLMFTLTNSVYAKEKSSKPNETVTATIKQTNVKSSKNVFKLSGTAEKEVKSLIIAIVDNKVTETNWQNLYKNNLVTAFTGDTITEVKNGKWNAEFKGIPSGNYSVLVYDSAIYDSSGKPLSDFKLLMKQPLVVKAPKSLKYKAGNNKEILLGVGQSVTDGGVKITLKDVFLTNGLTGSPRANFLIEPIGFASSTITLGRSDSSFNFSNKKIKAGGVKIQMIELSVPRNTAVFKVDIVSKG